MHIKTGIASKILGYIVKDENNTRAQEFMAQKFGRMFKYISIQGKQVNALINDDAFLENLPQPQKALWLSFAAVVNGFLGKNRDRHYQKLIKTLIQKLRAAKISVTLKIHTLISHLNKFPPSNSDFSDESAERFHHDFAPCIQRNHFSGIKLVKTMADAAWRLSRKPGILKEKNIQ